MFNNTSKRLLVLDPTSPYDRKPPSEKGEEEEVDTMLPQLLNKLSISEEGLGDLTGISENHFLKLYSDGTGIHAGQEETNNLAGVTSDTNASAMDLDDITQFQGNNWHPSHRISSNV